MIELETSRAMSGVPYFPLFSERAIAVAGQHPYLIVLAHGERDIERRVGVKAAHGQVEGLVEQAALVKDSMGRDR